MKQKVWLLEIDSWKNNDTWLKFTQVKNQWWKLLVVDNEWKVRLWPQYNTFYEYKENHEFTIWTAVSYTKFWWIRAKSSQDNIYIATHVIVDVLDENTFILAGPVPVAAPWVIGEAWALIYVSDENPWEMTADKPKWTVYSIIWQYYKENQIFVFPQMGLQKNICNCI